MTSSVQRPRAAGIWLIAGALGLLTAMAILPPMAGDTREVLTTFAANETPLLLADLCIVVAIVLLIPGSLALLGALRDRAPRLAPVAIGSFLVGWLFALGPVIQDRLMFQSATNGMPIDDAVALVKDLEADTGMSVVFGVFILGHTLGAILLGIALARTRFTPVWAGAAVAAGAILHPVARVGLESKGLDVFAFGLLALGLATAGLRLMALDRSAPEAARGGDVLATVRD